MECICSVNVHEDAEHTQGSIVALFLMCLRMLE